MCYNLIVNEINKKKHRISLAMFGKTRIIKKMFIELHNYIEPKMILLCTLNDYTRLNLEDIFFSIKYSVRIRCVKMKNVNITHIPM